MVVLFHQNMKNFGGATLARNVAYNGAFAAIPGWLGPAGPIVVAGFTEIVNNGAATNALSGAPAAIGGVNLCGALGVNFHAVVACGQTALAHGPEFIGLGVAAGFPVLSVGRIFINAGGSSINLIHDAVGLPPPSPAWYNSIHRDATLDYRGLVYVVVQIPPGVNIAVGFLHNLYTFQDQRTLVANSLPAMAALMFQNPAMGVGGHVYIGGDFNLLPANRGTARTGICYSYSAPTVAGPTLLPGATPGGTTWSGNLYDYWYSDIAPPAPGVPPIPRVNGTTMDSGGGGGNMSDHVAIFLSI